MSKKYHQLTPIRSIGFVLMLSGLSVTQAQSLTNSLSLINPGLDNGLPIVEPGFNPNTHLCEEVNSLCEAVVSDVPPDLRLKAAQLIEDVRNTEVAPGWENARLASEAIPLYRPGKEEIAYYEFRVVVPNLAGEFNTPAGFIVVSTGPHDFPIAHWNFEGQSPTQELTETAASLGQSVYKFYKLDTLSYAAEDSEGHLIASTGGDELPPKITGMDMDWLELNEAQVEISEAIQQPSPISSDDQMNYGIGISLENNVGNNLIINGLQDMAVETASWNSWSDFKAGYLESYGTLNESLRREATEQWEFDSLALTDGEMLSWGETYRLVALYDMPEPTLELKGEGVNFVEVELINRTALPSIVSIKVIDLPDEEVAPLEITLNYGEGIAQVAKFTIQPLVMELSSSSVGDEVLQLTGWGSWGYCWAGNHDDQRLYNQIPKGSDPNTSGCVSGCGATAWGMLIGWADHQAWIGNPRWKHRWGLYRQNGGYGADADAPKYMYPGVKNMIWEIRNHIETFCAFGSGATFPWKMSKVWKYLNGRTGATAGTHYNGLGIPFSSLRDRAKDSICQRQTPAIIGTGWLKHYPLAYGYRSRSRKVLFWRKYQREFYVNQGWGGSGNGWVNARTWFVGQLHPN